MKKLFDFIILIAILFLFVLALLFLSPSAHGQDVPCSWRFKLDTVRFKKLAYVDATEIKIVQNSYVVQSSENFMCPGIKQVITDRNKKIFFNGKEIDVLFLKQ